MQELTAFQRDLLFVIAGLEEPHGLAVKAEIESAYPSEVRPGRLYPNLDTLANRELIEKSEMDGRTNAYTLTDRGRDKLRDRLEWQQQYFDAVE